MYINGKPARDSPRESEREMQKYFLLPWTRALLTDNIFSDMRPRSVHDLKREFSAMNEQAKFSRREREIMDIIYARGQASATELAEAIADHPSRKAENSSTSPAGPSTRSRSRRCSGCWERFSAGRFSRRLPPTWPTPPAT
jgi:hypothetical protein